MEGSVINYNTSVWINKTNQVVSDTNVVLNVAISPTLWFLPSNLIILNKPIPGYNNKLKVSNESMKFGLNNDINREPIKEKHIEKEKHLDSLGNEKPKKVHQEIKT